MTLDTRIAYASRALDRAAKKGPLVLAYSGGKDALAVALLMRGRFRFECVCETSFYFEDSLTDIMMTAAQLGLRVRWVDSFGLDWVRAHPEIIFSDRSDVRSWTFAARQQKTVSRAQKEAPGSVAVFGRRRQENSVRDVLYETKHGWQCHPIMDWSTSQVWSFLEREGIPRPWIYSTEFGRIEGNAPFYTLRARDVGGVDAAWSLVESLDPRYSREKVLG